MRSLARPGENLNGFTINDLDVAPKRLQLLQEIDSKIMRIAAIYNPLSQAAARAEEEIVRAGLRLGIEVVGAVYRRAEELRPTLEKAAVAEVQAAITTTLTWPHRQIIIDWARERRLPVMYTSALETRDGELISLGANTIPQYRRAAMYIDRMLRGMKPEDLPVEQATENLWLVINLKTAKELGLTVPQALLARADEIIE